MHALSREIQSPPSLGHPLPSWREIRDACPLAPGAVQGLSSETERQDQLAVMRTLGTMGLAPGAVVGVQYAEYDADQATDGRHHQVVVARGHQSDMYMIARRTTQDVPHGHESVLKKTLLCSRLSAPVQSVELAGVMEEVNLSSLRRLRSWSMVLRDVSAVSEAVRSDALIDRLLPLLSPDTLRPRRYGDGASTRLQYIAEQTYTADDQQIVLAAFYKRHSVIEPRLKLCRLSLRSNGILADSAKQYTLHTDTLQVTTEEDEGYVPDNDLAVYDAVESLTARLQGLQSS